MWKECLEIFWLKSDRQKNCLRLLFSMTIVAVFFPVSIGDKSQINTVWFQLWCLVPMLIVMGIIPDAFAGERERRTLETLLASRLSNRAIVMGKMLVAIIYAWSLTVLFSLFLLVKINIIDRSQAFKFYPLDFLLSSAVGSLLLSVLVASIGVLASFKAESIKQAYKRTTTAVVVATLLPSVALLIAAFLFPPSVQQSIVSKFMSTGSSLAMVVSLFGLAVFDSVLLMLIFKLFERSRLMSD